MTKRKSRWMAVLGLMLGLMLFTCPAHAAETKALSKNMQVAVKIQKAKVYQKKSSKAKVVKSVSFGKHMAAKEDCGDWYKVSDGYVRKNDVVLYDKTKKHIALTFDDGPSKTNTKIVLDALKKHKAKATFMVIGQNVNKGTADLLKQEVKLGCEIGNHSYSHANFKKLSQKKVKAELKQTDDAVKKYTGSKPTVIRTPYGASSKSTLSCFDRPNIFWSVDTLDWKYRDTDRLVTYVSKNAKDGGIVLMHDIHKSTAKAVDRILKSLEKQGFETVTVTELSAINNVPMKAGTTYSSLAQKTKK